MSYEVTFTTSIDASEGQLLLHFNDACLDAFTRCYISLFLHHMLRNPLLRLLQQAKHALPSA